MDMKRSNIYFFVTIAILSVVGVIWGINEYSLEYNRQQEEMRRLFPHVLREVLDAHQKDIGPVRADTRTPKRMKTVAFQTKDGRKEIAVNSVGEKQNITSKHIDRLSHSVIMMENLIKIDSLYAQYLQCLATQSLHAKICILHKMCEKKKACLGDTTLIGISDSLISARVGVAHEHEFILYGTPMISSIVSGCGNRYLTICFILLLIGFISYLLKKHPYIASVSNVNGERIYMLTSHICLNIPNKHLYRVDKPENKVSLSSKDIKLLKAFFLTDTHQLNIMQIKQMAWDNPEIKETTVRVAIKVLNDKLKKVDKTFRIDSIRHGNYELILPDS